MFASEVRDFSDPGELRELDQFQLLISLCPLEWNHSLPSYLASIYPNAGYFAGTFPDIDGGSSTNPPKGLTEEMILDALKQTQRINKPRMRPRLEAT